MIGTCGETFWLIEGSRLALYWLLRHRSCLSEGPPPAIALLEALGHPPPPPGDVESNDTSGFAGAVAAAKAADVVIYVGGNRRHLGEGGA